MAENWLQSTATPEEIQSAYKKVELLLSSQKARDCIKKAEEALAFDREIFLLPIRDDLAECMEILADLIREKGTDGKTIQRLIPVLHDWLDPGSVFSQSVARIEKDIAEKKRKHPDFVYASKLNVLVQRYEDMLQDQTLDSIEYGNLLKKLESAKATLTDHIQKKVRIAMRSLTPDMLELAQAQLELTQLQEKVLNIKNELLNAAQSQAKANLQGFAEIFKEADPELANAIMAQTRSLVKTGIATELPSQKKIPKNLTEFKEELDKQKLKLENIEKQQQNCLVQIKHLMDFEGAIFNTYGEQLRAKGVQFRKAIKVEQKPIGTVNLTKAATGPKTRNIR